MADKKMFICSHADKCTQTERGCHHKRQHPTEFEGRDEVCREMVCRELAIPVHCVPVIPEGGQTGENQG